MTGDLRVAAERRGHRTRVTTLRASGLSRAGRPFESDSSAWIVVSTLGAGVLRDDRFTVGGSVSEGAHLVVSAASATRLFGEHGARSHIEGRWQVAGDAVLEVIGEPLLASGPLRHRSSLQATIEPGAALLVLDCIGCDDHAIDALEIETIVHAGSALVVHDAITVRRAAIGTLLFCTDRLAAAEEGELRTAMDQFAETLPDVRIGIGRPRNGGIAARVLGGDVWAVRSALHAMRRTLLARVGITQDRTLPVLTS